VMRQQTKKKAQTIKSALFFKHRSGAPDTDRTCDLSLRTTMAFATKKLVCGLDYTLAIDFAVIRPEPSSLYTFRTATGCPAWLGIASSCLHRRHCQGSPNLTPFTRHLSAAGAQFI